MPKIARRVSLEKYNAQVALENQESNDVPDKMPEFDVNFLAERLIVFAEKLTKLNFYDYEKEFAFKVFKSLLLNNGEEITALFARQSGKTETVAGITGSAMILLPTLAEYYPDKLSIYKNGIWVGMFAPRADQVDTTFLRTKMRIETDHAKMILSDPDLDLNLDRRYGGLRLSNGSFCKAATCNKQALIESKTYMLIFIDEAQDADSMQVLKSIHPMLAAYNGVIVKTGSPNRLKSDFFYAVKRNRRRKADGLGDYHTEVPYQIAIRDKKKQYEKDHNSIHLKYAQFIKKEKDRLGEDSDEFKMSYEIKWLFSQGTLITEDMFFEKMVDESWHIVTLDKEGTHVAGIDIGKSPCSTVCTVGKIDLDSVDEEGNAQLYVENWLELFGEDHESQFGQIVEFLNNYNVRVVYIDSQGKGDPVADRFIGYYDRYDSSVVVRGYPFSGLSAKSILWKTLLTEVNAGRIHVPGKKADKSLARWKRFKEQVTNLTKSWRGAFLVCGKDPMIKGSRDDFADSLALMVLASKDGTMVEMQDDDFNIFKDVARRRRLNRRYIFGY